MNITIIPFMGNKRGESLNGRKPALKTPSKNQRTAAKSLNKTASIKRGDPYDTYISKDRKKAQAKAKGTGIIAAALLMASAIITNAATGKDPIDDEPKETKPAVVDSDKKTETKKPATYTLHIKDDNKKPKAIPVEPIEEPVQEVVQPIDEEKAEEEKMFKKLDSMLGDGFSAKLVEVCSRLNCKPKDMATMMYSESGLLIDSTNEYSAGGLAQIMPEVAETLGTTVDELRTMDAKNQLDYVEECISFWRDAYDMPPERELTGGELYALNFVPGYFNDEVLVYAGMWEYEQNTGLDFNKDGSITIEDLSGILDTKYQEFISLC